MTDIVRVNATLDRDLLARVDHYAARHHEDRSTAIRQLLHLALRQLATTEGIAAFRDGRLTVRELASLLDLDTWATHDLLAARGIPIAQGTIAETATDLAAVIAGLEAPAKRRRPRP